MIFADMDYSGEYEDFHWELLSYLNAHFSQVESGIQSDSWFWIWDGEEKVKIDTFTAKKHQVKSTKAGPLVLNVISTLMLKYKLKVYDKPELEAHEDDPPTI